MKINVIGQVPFRKHGGTDRGRYFFNRDSVNGQPGWVSPMDETIRVGESPDRTIDQYIKRNLKSNFYIRFIYD